MALKKEILIYMPWVYFGTSYEYNDLIDIFNEMRKYFNITIITIDDEGRLLGNRKQRYYEEKRNKVTFIKIAISKKKIIYHVRSIKNFFIYFINAMNVTRSLVKVDYIFAVSTPPIVGGILGFAGKFIKKAKFIYNVEEFIPEEYVISGKVENKLLLKLQMFIDTHSCKVADRVIVRSNDMKLTLKKRFKDTVNIPSNVSINKYIDTNYIYPLEKYDNGVVSFKKKYKLNNKFLVMYLGDMELYNDVSSITETLGRFRDRNDVLFLFIGNGSSRKLTEEYVSRCRLDNVIFLSISKEEILYYINAADVILISYMKAMKGILFPWEIYMAMAAGKAIIALLDEGCDGREIIEETSCGITIDSGDYATLYKIIRGVLEDPTLINDMGSKGRAFVESIDRNSIIEKYKKVILET